MNFMIELIILTSFVAFYDIFLLSFLQFFFIILSSLLEVFNEEDVIKKIQDFIIAQIAFIYAMLILFYFVPFLILKAFPFILHAIEYLQINH